MADEHLYEDALKYIEEKLLILFGYREKANTYQKLHNLFSINEIKKKNNLCFFNQKRCFL